MPREAIEFWIKNLGAAVIFMAQALEIEWKKRTTETELSLNFTKHFRGVLKLADEEARRMRHDYIGTEHLLLALSKSQNTVGVTILSQIADLDKIQERIHESVRRGKTQVPLGELPWTSYAKRAVEFARHESRDMGTTYVGTDHLLLGLIREEKSIGGQILSALDVTLDDTRDAVKAHLSLP